MKIETVRNILKGYRVERAGVTRTVVPESDTLALMADALGNVAPADLENIGRPDAARALRILHHSVDGNEDSSLADRLAKIRDELDSLVGELRDRTT